MNIGEKCCHMSPQQSLGSECSTSWELGDTEGSRTIDTLNTFSDNDYDENNNEA